MRIMFISNAPWAGTGYGQQTKHIVPGLESLGHNVAVFPFWGLQGGILEHEGRPNYPIWNNEWGNDVFAQHADHYKADLVITLTDVWVLHEEYGKMVNWCPYTPIDHVPVPPAVVSHLKTAKRVIAMSRFGQEELKKAGINADYIPHGVDVDTFKPVTPEQKAQAKMRLGFPPDCFLVGMVAANKGWPCRKCFSEAFEAFTMFLQKHPNARMYCHSEPSNRYGGPDLSGMAQTFGIQPFLRFPNPYMLNLGGNGIINKDIIPNGAALFSETQMAETVYGAFDVLLAASMGEGFGVPILEAQACGLPVITTDCTSMIELTAAGWKVPVARKFWTPLNAFQFLPFIPGIADALEAAYTADRVSMGKVAREFAMDYRWKKIINEGWKPFLERLEPVSYAHAK